MMSILRPLSPGQLVSRDMVVSALQYAEELLDRADRLRAAAAPLAAVDSVDADLLRSAWSFTAAASDTYFHKRVRSELLARPISKTARKKFELSIGDVDDLVESFLADRTKARPRVKLKNLVDEKLATLTFQGSTNIEHAFGLMGVSKYWKDISAEMGETADEIKLRLNKQYARRNRIAHEGDFARAQRPQAIKYQQIDQAAVADEIGWTRSFLRAVDKVT